MSEYQNTFIYWFILKVKLIRYTFQFPQSYKNIWDITVNRWLLRSGWDGMGITSTYIIFEKGSYWQKILRFEFTLSVSLELNHTPISGEFSPSPHSTRPLLQSTSLYAPLNSYFQPCTILVFVIISRKVTRYIQTLLLEPKMVKLLKLGGGVDWLIDWISIYELIIFFNIVNYLSEY